MKSIDLTMKENELKFFLDLMWGVPSKTVTETAVRHQVDDKSLEEYIARCLGYCALQEDG